MDPKLFQERLAELAELKPIKPATTAATRAPVEPEEIIRHGQVFTVSKKDNPSWLYQVKKLKTEAKQCEHCDRVVKDQTIAIRFLGYPEPHRRETCSVCRKTKNPETGAFDLLDMQANNFFTSYFRKRNK